MPIKRVSRCASVVAAMLFASSTTLAGGLNVIVGNGISPIPPWWELIGADACRDVCFGPLATLSADLEPACIGLNFINIVLGTNPGQVLLVGTSAGSNLAIWQTSASCCQLVPTRRATWSAVKQLHH